MFYVVVAEGSLMRLHTNPAFQVVASKITTTKVRVVVQVQLHKLSVANSVNVGNIHP